MIARPPQPPAPVDGDRSENCPLCTYPLAIHRRREARGSIAEPWLVCPDENEARALYGDR